ncbi:hypothetical protein CS542_10080 [Pedobacter sp. IW39]|nr:hypothetical protein CS542_10080 [Pedobacter sp. IW39]
MHRPYSAFRPTWVLGKVIGERFTCGAIAGKTIHGCTGWRFLVLWRCFSYPEAGVTYFAGPLSDTAGTGSR